MAQPLLAIRARPRIVAPPSFLLRRTCPRIWAPPPERFGGNLPGLRWRETVGAGSGCEGVGDDWVSVVGGQNCMGGGGKEN